MPSLVLDIVISPERLLALYQGRANRILVRSREGKRVSLPAHHLRPFFSREGLNGSFVLDFTDKGELISLRPL